MLINVSLVGAKLGDSSQTNWQYFSLLNRVIAGFSLVASFSYFVVINKLSKYIINYRFAALIIAAILIRVFSIIASPNPSIDVFYLLRDGPRLLLHGENPYKLDYPAPYGVYNPTIQFVYGPLVAFLFLPADIIFNDPRYTLVFFELISATFIFLIGKKLSIDRPTTEVITIIFLFHPLFPFITEHSWLEPVIFTFIAAGVYFRTVKNANLGSLLLGAILAIKVVYALPLLVYLKSKGSRFRDFLIFLIIPTLLTIPFLWTDKELFIKRTLFDSGAIQNVPRLTNVSLNVSAVLLKYFHVVIPLYLVVLIGIAFSLIVIYLPKEKNSLIALFLTFFILFMVGPYLVLNYFYLLGNILLLALLCFLSKKEIPERA